MIDGEGVSLFLYRGATFRIDSGVQPPKTGSLLFCRHLDVRPGERVLEIGAGAGLAAVMAARAGAVVIATDVRPESVACTRENAERNGVTDRVDVRLGDGFAPVAGLTFDLVCTSPPQMPTPPGRERDDAEAAADNGGRDGWALLDRVIREAPVYLVPAGASSSRCSASSASSGPAGGSARPASHPRSWRASRSPSRTSATSAWTTCARSTTSRRFRVDRSPGRSTAT